MAPRTGKTLTTLALNAHDYERGLVKNTLIIGPKVSEDVWYQQIEEHTTDGPDYYFVTHQSVWRDPDYLEYPWDSVIVDESHCIANPQSKQSKAAHRIPGKYRYILTGTPVDKDHEEFYSQFKFCNPKLFGESLKAFREKWCKAEPVMVNGRPLPYVYKYKLWAHKRKAFMKRISPYSFSWNDSGLAPFEDIWVPVKMSERLRQLYREFHNEAIVEWRGRTLVGAHAFTVRLRLMQLASGILKDEDDRITVFDSHKLRAARDKVVSSGQPAVIFVRWRVDILRLKKLLPTGLKVIEISGKRKDNWRSSWDVAIVQVQSGGVAIDLSRARQAHFVSHPDSYRHYYQALCRIRGGDPRIPVEVYSYGVDTTIDKQIHEMLKRKQSVTDNIFSSLKEIY